jgi:hypothetical protein
MGAKHDEPFRFLPLRAARNRLALRTRPAASKAVDNEFPLEGITMDAELLAGLLKENASVEQMLHQRLKFLVHFRPL